MIHIHASGVLLSPPQSRTSAKGTPYTTALLKCSGKDADTMVSFVCFAETVQEELQALAAGDALTVTGNGKLTSWTGKDGEEKHGLSVVADRVLAHSPRQHDAGQPDSTRQRRWPPQVRKAEHSPAAERSFNDSIPF